MGRHPRLGIGRARRFVDALFRPAQIPNARGDLSFTPARRRQRDALAPSLFVCLGNNRASGRIFVPGARKMRARKMRVGRGGLPMEATMINEYARQLMDAHGQRAIAEAAQRAAESERNKDNEEAKTWRRVEQALKTMCGPIAS
jgi:hypothetical protein